MLRMGYFHGASPRVKGYKKGCEHIVTYKAIWLALYIVPVIALALCMLQKRKTLAKRCRRRKSGYVVCIPDFVAVLGTVFAAAASLLGVYAVLTASGQLSEMIVIYLICGGG